MLNYSTHCRYTHVIAKPVRTLVVAIRTPVAIPWRTDCHVAFSMLLAMTRNFGVLYKMRKNHLKYLCKYTKVGKTIDIAEQMY